jgi:hypothetical protein
MNHYLTSLVSYIAPLLAAGGGGAVIAWLIIKSFGDKWLENKFSESLETFKHAKNEELEKLRFEIATLMDRTVKLHQREFDVLPEAWGLLADAFAILQPVALGVGMAPDIRNMTTAQFEFFMANIPLEDFQKDELRNSPGPDQQTYYLNAIMRHDLDKAIDSCGAFHLYLKKNGIFILPSIKSKFSAFDEFFTAVIKERKASLSSRQAAQKFDKGLELHEKGPGLLTALENDVQGRLWSGINS